MGLVLALSLTACGEEEVIVENTNEEVTQEKYRPRKYRPRKWQKLPQRL
ncbi:MAG: hypothetical protein ACLR6I_20020 [Waltera sp.]